jgi:preprotein translocase subunit YajC
MIDQLPLTLAQMPGPGGHPAVAPAGESSTVAPAGSQPGGSGGGSSGGRSGGGGFDGSLMFIVLAMVGVMLFMTWNSSRKDKKRRQLLLSNLKKGDKVATVSGIIGSVVEMRDNEVVLKVDENSNTRIKFRKAAIEAVLEERAADGKE